MPSRKLKDAHPRLQSAFQQALPLFKKEFPELDIIITCTYRSLEEQAALYNQPWDKKDNDQDGKIDESDERVTRAKPGQSKHNVLPSHAIDIAFKHKNGKLTWNLVYFKKFYDYLRKFDPKIIWGGHFKAIDGCHYEI